MVDRRFNRNVPEGTLAFANRKQIISRACTLGDILPHICVEKCEIFFIFPPPLLFCRLEIWLIMLINNCLVFELPSFATGRC